MPTSANLIAKYLANAGVKRAYGIPGGEVLAIIDALENNHITFTLVKHENAGGFMAEGSYHASGVPGVLVATLGPGVANAINFIANAFQDQVPIIFLTGCVDDKEAMTFTHQIFDHQALLKPITKATFKMPDGAVEETIDKAINIAMDDPPGPVHIDIPINVATTLQVDRPLIKRCRPAYGIPNTESLKAAIEHINHASKPLVIAGMGVLHHQAEAQLNQFLLAHNIPLLTTYKAKGILPEDHALSLGATGLSPKSESVIIPLVQEADLLILLGYDPIEMRAGWRNVWNNETTVLEFDTQSNTHYMHQSHYHFYCDLRKTLAYLQQNISPGTVWPNGEIEKVKKATSVAFSTKSQWGPHAIIQTARKALPDNTVATVDTGAHRILFNQLWNCYQPRTLFQSNCLCTMGVAAPMALGYKQHQPLTPVVAFTGDAGMEMVLGDLATIRDSGLALILVIFVDQSLALIELKQRAMGLDNLGVDFDYTDFVSIGRAYGFHSEWVDDANTLTKELTSALDRKYTTILACRFARQAYDGAF